MIKKIGMLAGAVALIVAGQTRSQESLVDYVVEACKVDLETYCSQVTPGQGRLLYCVAAHEDKLSGQCEYALYQAASALEQLAAAIRYFAESCETEITTLCRDVQAGQGRILACLNEHDDQVGDACRKAIQDTVGG